MGSVRAASRQSPQEHFLGCFSRTTSIGDPVPQGGKDPLHMGHGPRTGREMPAQPEPPGFVQAGWGGYGLSGTAGFVPQLKRPHFLLLLVG